MISEAFSNPNNCPIRCHPHPATPHRSPSPPVGLSCPANSHPELCSWGCSRTCGAVGHALAGCSARCREGCVCNRGFLLSGDRCVPADQCGCVHQGFYYEAEETFSSPTEGQCRCQAGGTISCDRPPCPANSEGRVVDGVYQCMPVAPGLCVATGDRSYRSFDGVAFSISGTCSYILTETCSDEVQPFMVKIQKEARKKGKVSSIQELSIKVYGLTLTLPRDKRGDVLVRWFLVVQLFLGATKVYGCISVVGCGGGRSMGAGPPSSGPTSMGSC